MADALKPCRWCDGTEVSPHSNGDAFHWVQCNDERCLAEGPIRTTEADALAAWNRRAPLAPPTDAEVISMAQAMAVSAGNDPAEEIANGATVGMILEPHARAALAAFVAGRNGAPLTAAEVRRIAQEVFKEGLLGNSAPPNQPPPAHPPPPRRVEAWMDPVTGCVTLIDPGATSGWTRRDEPADG